jgi:hypothetical protein
MLKPTGKAAERIQKKKLSPTWRSNGVSRAAQMKEAARLFKQALILTKKGRTKQAQIALRKAEKIRQSMS